MDNLKSNIFLLVTTFAIVLAALGWWFSAEVDPSMAGIDKDAIRSQCGSSGDLRSPGPDCSATHAGTSRAPLGASPKWGANPFGYLDCSRQQADPDVFKMCNPSEDEQQGLAVADRDPPSDIDTSDMQANIARLNQGLHLVESTVGIILGYKSCQPAPADTAAESAASELPGCAPALLKEIDARTESALLQTYGRAPSAQSEHALGMWQMATTSRALGEYVALRREESAAAPSAVDAARTKVMTEWHRLRQFESNLRFSDGSVNEFLLTLEGIE